MTAGEETDFKGNVYKNRRAMAAAYGLSITTLSFLKRKRQYPFTAELPSAAGTRHENLKFTAAADIKQHALRQKNMAHKAWIAALLAGKKPEGPAMSEKYVRGVSDSAPAPFSAGTPIKGRPRGAERTAEAAGTPAGKNIIARLNDMLSIAWAVTALTKNAHHNAGKEDFFPTHKMYDLFFNGAADDGGYQPQTQYADNIAERVITLGGRAAETLSEMSAIASALLPDCPKDLESSEDYNSYMLSLYQAADNEAAKFIKQFSDSDDVSCGRISEFRQALQYYLMYLRKITA